MTTNDIIEAALKLPKKARAKLADRLRQSLESSKAIDDAIDEADRDWHAYERGEMKGRPVEEVFPAMAKKRSSR